VSGLPPGRFAAILFLPELRGEIAWIYAFSIILPMICYLLITKWPGIAYARSRDEKTRNIGIVACLLLGLSTVVTFYFAYVWTQEAVQQSVSQINADMSI
jgi:hypothetical protein